MSTVEEQEDMARRKLEAINRYDRACHAVQTGVATEQSLGSADGTPKHLRTGLNLRAVDHSALAKLLIERHVFTELEYLEALAQAAEEEMVRYEKRLSEATGSKITLA